MTGGQPETGSQHEKAYLPQLTGVRAGAAYAVYLFHFNPFPPEWAQGFLYRFTNELHVGVTFFYVLSGFLIYYNYGQKIQRLSLPFLQQYARNRFARIYPVYFFVLMSTYILLHWPSWQMMLVQLTLTQALFPPYITSGIAQAWTLTVEETFYFTAPFIFLAARRWTLAAPVIGIVIAGIFLSVFSGRPDYVFGKTLCGAIFPFSAGILLAMRVIRRHHILLEPRRGPITTLSLLTCGILVAIMSQMTHSSDDGADDPMVWNILFLVLPAFIAIFYWGLITEESWLRRMLSSKYAVLLGGASFAFYLIHQGVFQILIDHVLGPNNLIRFLLLNVFAMLLFEGFERPVNRYLRGTAREKSEARPDRRLWNRWTSGLMAVILVPVVVDLGIRISTGKAPGASLLASYRGDFYLSHGVIDAAMAQYQRAVDLFDGNRVAQERLGTWHLVEGRPADAIRHWQALVQREPSDQVAQLQLGISLLRSGNLDEAVASLQRVLELDPRSAEAHNLIGIAMLRKERWDEAAARFSIALDIHPKSAEYHSNLGVVFVRQNRLQEARAQFEQALGADPSNAEARDNLHRLESMLQK